MYLNILYSNILLLTNTLINEINLLPPGEYIIYENNKINKETYYDFQNNLEENLLKKKN